jgi:uncharacterized protein YjbI with pentapeptide repeats
MVNAFSERLNSRCDTVVRANLHFGNPAKAPRRHFLLILLLALAGVFPSIAAAAADEPAPPAPALIEIGDPATDVQTTPLSGVVSCPYCNMTGADLSGRDLTDANLTGAILVGAKMRDTILNGAALIGADLRNADLKNAKLNPSTLAVTDLSRANLVGADLEGAQMNGTDLQFAKIGGANFSGIDLTRAVFGPRVDTTHPEGKKTVFAKARMRHEFAIDAATTDITGVDWLAPDGVPTGEAEDTVCGRADLGALTSRIYVANDGTDDGSCGSAYDKSCKTVAYGLGRCGPSGCGVLVRWDVYPTTASIVLRDSVNLYGGCLPRSQSRPEYFSAVLAPPGGVASVTAKSINAGAIVQGFQLNASVATGNSATSVAVGVSDSAKLSLLDVELVADRGGKGASAGTGGAGSTGGNGSGRSGGTVGSCGGTTGGEGSVRRDVTVDNGAFSFTCKPSCSANSCYGYNGSPASTGFWAPGGARGGDNCTECPRSRGDTGARGTDGRHAGCGGKGTVSNNVAGSFSGDRWVASQGGTGGTGGDGGGGGGGGSGGYKAGSCFWVKTQDKGNTGGGGGAGGCRAGAGGGGLQGGAAFALLATRSNVTLTRARLVAGTGGDGSNGGTGGQGGRGGTGAAGATNEDGGFGGAGATGGAGGAGGGGAGGNGGPAVGAALVGGASIVGSPVYYAGQSGTPGESGRGGSPIVAAACTAANGDNGVKGLVANTQTY